MALDEIQRAAQEQYARQSHHYGRGHVLENVEDVQSALEFIPLLAPAKVLDIATGAGHTGLYLASLGHDVILADLAQPMLERALRAARERGLTVQVRQHAAEELPYPDSTFDLVTCRMAAHHFSSPENFIRETARILKPQAWLLLIDRSVEDGQPEAEAWLHAVEKWRDPSHVRLLTPRVIRGLCGAHGLVCTHVTMTAFKQPDLNRYFETAATPLENQKEVLKLVAHAPESARELFRLAEEAGRIGWWWQRLTLLARKA